MRISNFIASHCSCLDCFLNLALSETPKTGFVTSRPIYDLSRDMRSPTMWYVRPAKPQISLRIKIVKLLTENHFKFLSKKEAAEARPSLHMSKCHIVGNLMSHLISIFLSAKWKSRECATRSRKWSFSFISCPR